MDEKYWKYIWSLRHDNPHSLFYIGDPKAKDEGIRAYVVATRWAKRLTIALFLIGLLFGFVAWP